MNKLGVAIKLTNDGAGQPLVINEGGWVSRVVEVRDELKYISGCENYDKIVRLLSFCETGSLITLVRPISGRSGDNISAWLYIPNSIIISGKEIVGIIKSIEDKILKPTITRNELEGIVAKEYPVKSIITNFNPSAKKGYAFRIIGFYPLENILGENRYQAYYSQYRYIFLIEVAEDIKEGIQMDDLSQKTIEELCIFIPAEINDITKVFGHKHVKIGFKEDQCEFSAPILQKKGVKVELFAYREGFEPIYFDVVVDSNEQKCELPQNPSPWKRKISYKMFKVVDTQSQKEVNRYTITVLDIEVSFDQDIYLAEQECEQVSVTVRAEGYDDYEDILNLNDLFSNNKRLPISIPLAKKEHIVKRNVILANEQICEVSFSTRSDLLQYASPFKGYLWNKEKRAYEFNIGLLIKNKIVGAAYGVMGLLICLMLYGAVAFIGSHKLHRCDAFPWVEFQLVKDLETELQSVKKELDATKKKANDAQTELKTVKTELDATKKKANDAQTELEEVKTKLAGAQTKVKGKNKKTDDAPKEQKNENNKGKDA